jgi:hypothetical protein
MRKVTAEYSLAVAVPPERAWDYTQDWNRRTEWDRSVAHAEIISDDPRIVRVRARGGDTFEVSYKQSDRPNKTSLVMNEFSSFWFRGGGGSWKYESRDGQTWWTQRNTLILRDDWLGALTAPIFRWILDLTTRAMMRRAKKILESSRSTD